MILTQAYRSLKIRGFFHPVNLSAYGLAFIDIAQIAFIHEPLFEFQIVFLGICIGLFLWNIHILFTGENRSGHFFEISALFYILLAFHRIPFFFPIDIRLILLVQGVMWIFLHLDKPTFAGIPSLIYLALFDSLYNERFYISHMNTVLIWVFLALWFFVHVQMNAKIRAYRDRFFHLSTEFIKLRTGVEWFTKSPENPVRLKTGQFQKEREVRAGDAYKEFEKWWLQTVLTFLKDARIVMTALYLIGETELKLLASFCALHQDNHWKETIQTSLIQNEMHIMDHGLFTADRLYFDRFQDRWLHQPILHFQGFFTFPIRFNDSGNLLWVGLIDTQPDQTIKKLISWLGKECENMATIHRIAFLQQDRSETIGKITEVCSNLASTLSIKEVLDLFIPAIKAIVPFDGGILALKDEETARPKMVWSQGVYGSRRRTKKRIPMYPGEGSWAMWMLERRTEPLHLHSLPNRQDLPLWSKELSKSPWPYLLGFPLRVQNTTIGVLFLGRKKGDFRSEEVHWLSIVIHQASLAFRNAQLFEKTKHLAERDSLTGSYNHRTFQEKLESAISIIRERKSEFTELSLVMFDIDYFKQINDTYGHPFGDYVLVKVTELIRQKIRHYDVLARYGGEEFALILQGCNGDVALHIADEIRSSVENHRFRRGLESIQVTISGGIATFPGDARNRSELIERADTALYYAKRQGRNQVWHWQDIERTSESHVIREEIHVPWWKKLFRVSHER